MIKSVNFLWSLGPVHNIVVTALHVHGAAIREGRWHDDGQIAIGKVFELVIALLSRCRDPLVEISRHIERGPAQGILSGTDIIAVPSNLEM